MNDFQKELEALLNRHCQENASNTPDFILAEFLTACLNVWNGAVVKRAEWYGRMDRPGGPVFQPDKRSWRDFKVMEVEPEITFKEVPPVPPLEVSGDQPKVKELLLYLENEVWPYANVLKPGVTACYCEIRRIISEYEK